MDRGRDAVNCKSKQQREHKMKSFIYLAHDVPKGLWSKNKGEPQKKQKKNTRDSRVIIAET